MEGYFNRGVKGGLCTLRTYQEGRKGRLTKGGTKGAQRRAYYQGQKRGLTKRGLKKEQTGGLPRGAQNRSTKEGAITTKGASKRGTKGGFLQWGLTKRG